MVPQKLQQLKWITDDKHRTPARLFGAWKPHSVEPGMANCDTCQGTAWKNDNIYTKCETDCDM